MGGYILNKTKLILIAMSPILIGYMLNFILRFIPYLIYMAPFLMLAYWFWAGMQYAKIVKNPVIAISLANSIGIISILLYYWQFVILPASERILAIAAFSQMFTTPLDYISALTRSLFKAANELTQVTTITMQTFEIVLMLIVFSCGYFYMKYKPKS